MATTCNCKASTAQNLTTRPIDDTVYEVGIVCPKCGVFTHSHFYNDNLEQKSNHLSQRGNINRKNFRSYQQAFDSLQKEYRSKKHGITSGTS